MANTSACLRGGIERLRELPFFPIVPLVPLVLVATNLTLIGLIFYKVCQLEKRSIFAEGGTAE